jgi:hypothetical protein
VVLDNGNTRGRQSRRPHGSYQFPIERRAAVAAGIAAENGWPTKQAAGLLCVNPVYVNLARHLSAEDRLRLARGELKLAQLHKQHLQSSAERRAKKQKAKLEAEQARREAQARAARQAELENHSCLPGSGQPHSVPRTSHSTLRRRGCAGAIGRPVPAAGQQHRRSCHQRVRR